MTTVVGVVMMRMRAKERRTAESQQRVSWGPFATRGVWTSDIGMHGAPFGTVSGAGSGGDCPPFAGCEASSTHSLIPLDSLSHDEGPERSGHLPRG
eukprot:7285925-Pyramimonas_sp.AAC.1